MTPPLNFNIYNLIIIVASIQGLIFSVFVFFNPKYKSNSNFYLPPLIGAISLNNLYYWFIDINFIKNIEIYRLFYIPWALLIVPMYYYFVNSYLQNKKLKVNGHAWAGDLEVSEMHVSIDFGSTWQLCDLKKPVNRLAWQQWSAEIEFPQNGYYEIWAKATDSKGKSQPMVIPGWNPKGYLNNSCHRIAVKIK